MRLALFAMAVWCQAATLAAPQLPFSRGTVAVIEDSDRTLAFALHLESEGDYYRAITEYKRVDFMSTVDDARRAARLGIARCYHAGRKWPALERACRNALDLGGYGKRDRTDLKVARALALWNLGRADEAHTLLESVPDVDLQEADRHLEGWVAVAAGEIDAAKLAFESIQHGNALEALATWPPERLSPGLAGLMSGILPGAGQLYAGKPKAAGGAILVNGLLLAGTIEAFDEDQEALGWGLALLTLGFWSGNVHGAMNFSDGQNHENFVERDTWLARNLYMNDRFRENFSWSFKRP